MKLKRRPRPVALLILLCLAAFAPGSLSAQDFTGKRIRKISFDGLKRTSEEELLYNLGEKVSLDRLYDEIAVSDATKTLWLTQRFSWVDVAVRDFEDGVEIVFTVQEKSLVTSLRFVAEDTAAGKPSLGAKTLQEAISTAAGKGLSPYALEMDAQQIVQTYQDEGYTFVEVRHELKEAEGNAQVTFFIKEGPRLRIRDVSFVGNTSIKSSTLRGLMATRKKDWFFGFFHSGFYQRDELNRDVDKIKTYYQSQGFFDVLAAVDGVDFYDGNRKMRVRIVVEEGPRYVFTGYKLSGNQVFSESTLLGLTQARPGRFFSAERMELDRAEILKYYKDRAYIDATVTPSWIFPAEGTTVEVRFQIEENHEIYIDHVHIRGNVKTRDEVIRRELEFYPGEKFNWDKQQKSRSNLARLRFFRDIAYEYQETAPNRKDVIVTVEEEATGRLLLGFGVTSGFGVIGNLAISKRNFDFTDLPDSIYDIPDSFTGAGQTLNIVLQPGTRRSLYQLAFTEPYLFDTRNSLTVAGSKITILRDDYDEERLSFKPSLGHAFDFDRDLVFSVGGRAEEVEIHDIDKDARDVPDFTEVKGFTTVIAANGRIDYDKVFYEPLEGPYSGHQEWLEFEYGGGPFGGDVEFAKLEGALALYYPIYVHEEGRLHHVISLYTKFGVMEGIDDSEDDIPIFERFFIGGPNTVRGFRFRGLGPHFSNQNDKFTNDALGGTAAWYGNIEYSFPLFQKFVRGVLFFDYGNLDVEPSQFTLDRMRYAIGAGVRMNFPFLGQPLPIGLYLGKAIKKEDFDRTRTFLFTIGTPF